MAWQKIKIKHISFLDLLSDIVDNRGRTCPTIENNSGIPLIATNCITNETLYPLYDKVRYISQETYNTWFRGHPRSGDMIFVCKGSPGRVCMVPDPVDFCIAQDMVAIRADEKKIYPRFLFALLRSNSVQNSINNMHVGTLIPHFKKGDFGKLILEIPEDHKIQKSIGDIYFDFSSKIELNRKVSKTLEAMAQALFKSWFVDFEPVRAKIEAKAAGRDPELAAMSVISGKSEAELRSMPKEQFKELAHIASLFPDELVDSELGEIPKGWNAGKITSVADVVGGGTPSTQVKEYFTENGIPWLTPKDLSGNKSKFVSRGAIDITNDALNNSGARLMPAGTVLFSSRAPIGYIAIAENKISTNQGFKSLVPQKGMCSEYLYQYLSHNLSSIEAIATGSTFKEMSGSAMKSLNIIIPPENIVCVYEQKTAIINRQILNNQKQIVTLSLLRDILLSKLLSGELNV